jgi:hypothetical protein
MKIGIVGVVLMAALLVGPARAQQGHVPAYGEEDKEKSATEKTNEKEAERAYKRSLGNIPEQKSSDPWGTVRSDGASAKTTEKTTEKTTAKAAHVKPKPKTESKADTTTKQ